MEFVFEDRFLEFFQLASAFCFFAVGIAISNVALSYLKDLGGFAIIPKSIAEFLHKLYASGLLHLFLRIAFLRIKWLLFPSTFFGFAIFAAIDIMDLFNIVLQKWLNFLGTTYALCICI